MFLRIIYLSGLFLCYWPTTKCVVFNTTRLNSKSFWVVLSLSCCNTRGRAEAAKTSKMSYADRWLIQKYYLLFSNSCRCSWYISIDRSDFDALFTFKSRLVFVEIGWIIYGRPENKWIMILEKKIEIKIYPERCPRDSAYFEYAERLVDSGSEE